MFRPLLARASVLVVLVAALGLASCDAPATAPPAALAPGAADITVVTTPPGATVLVDGAAVGTGPVTVKLSPGPHRLRATMSGYYPVQEMKIVVERSTPATHNIALVTSH